MVWTGAAAAGISALGGIAGGMMSGNSAKKSAKKQFEYARALQLYDQAFQREVGQNAHQWEMQDLEKAGLNPALTVTGSSAGSIAGGSSHQSSSPGAMANFDMSQIANDINTTRRTNADVEKTETEKDAIPQQLSNDATNAKANLISAQAAMKNAENQEEVTKGGWGTRILGTDSKFAKNLPGTIGILAGLAAGGGIVKGAWGLGKNIAKAKTILKKPKRVLPKLKLRSSAR